MCHSNEGRWVPRLCFFLLMTGLALSDALAQPMPTPKIVKAKAFFDGKGPANTVVIQTSADEILEFDASGGVLELGARNLVISAHRVTVKGNVVIRTFGFSSTPPPFGDVAPRGGDGPACSGDSCNGNPGEVGRTGAEGKKGADAGKIVLELNAIDGGTLTIAAIGQRGGSGQTGGTGGTGSAGNNGRDRGGCNAFCRNCNSPTNGGTGGAAGPGGPGGPGGVGGRGVNVSVSTTASALLAAGKLQILAFGGLGGDGGGGGQPGTPGGPGSMGHGNSCGGGGTNGSPGAPNTIGPAGQVGTRGAHGTIICSDCGTTGAPAPLQTEQSVFDLGFAPQNRSATVSMAPGASRLTLITPKTRKEICFTGMENPTVKFELPLLGAVSFPTGPPLPTFGDATTASCTELPRPLPFLLSSVAEPTVVIVSGASLTNAQSIACALFDVCSQ